MFTFDKIQVVHNYSTQSIYTGEISENAVNVDILTLRATDQDGPGVNSAIQYTIISECHHLLYTSPTVLHIQQLKMKQDSRY